MVDIDTQISIITKGCIDVISHEDLKTKLIRSQKTNTPLRIKYGADPSTSDIHLGHTVPLLKLREIQELGHEIIFLIGDFTAMVGDPTGRSETRNMLTPEQVSENARTYQDQVFKILDKDKTTVVYNSHWLNKLTPHDFLVLTSKYTVARILERDDFNKRFKSDKPITILEFLYPLLQGYDSVALRSDLEIGGTDQKFNLLVGRNLQRDYGQEPQIVLTMPLIEGTDGVQKMSKSYGNAINLTDTSTDMFGKIMSLPDSLLIKYFTYLTNVGPEALQKMKHDMDTQSVNPKNLKVQLACNIITFYFDRGEAERVVDEFNRVFRDKGIPDDIPLHSVAVSQIDIISLLNDYKLVKSRSEAKRLIEQGGVKVNGEKISDINFFVSLENETLVQCGKRVFAKFINTK